jgi:hypothetical protein
MEVGMVEKSLKIGKSWRSEMAVEVRGGSGD